MKPRNEYLYAVQIKDTFHALGLDNYVHIWCMQTGANVTKNTPLEFNIAEKLASKLQRKNCDFEVYRSCREIKNDEQGIYNQGLLPYTLIYQKDEEKDITDD